jgi:hypothetical protein
MNPKSLTPKQIGEMLAALETIEQIGKAVRERAVELLHAGTDIPGYEAAFTSPHRAWTDEAEASGELARLGLKEDERYVTALLTPAAAEAKLKAKKLWPKKPRGSAAADFTDPIASIVSKPEGKPTLRKLT